MSDCPIFMWRKIYSNKDVVFDILRWWQIDPYFVTYEVKLGELQYLDSSSLHADEKQPEHYCIYGDYPHYPLHLCDLSSLSYTMKYSLRPSLQKRLILWHGGSSIVASRPFLAYVRGVGSYLGMLALGCSCVGCCPTAALGALCHHDKSYLGINSMWEITSFQLNDFRWCVNRLVYMIRAPWNPHTTFPFTKAYGSLCCLSRLIQSSQRSPLPTAPSPFSLSTTTYNALRHPRRRSWTPRTTTRVGSPCC